MTDAQFSPPGLSTSSRFLSNFASSHQHSTSLMPTHNGATRIAGLGTTVFAEMSALARRHNAVNLGQGFPDFETPEELIEAHIRALRDGHNQYAVSHGEAVLRNAIADHAGRRYGQAVDPEREVTVTSGATEGILCTMLGLIEPGDEVIVIEPFYDSYVPTIRWAGGVPVAVTLASPDFLLDLEAIGAAITDRTRMIVVNTPHNPTGRVFTEEEMEGVARLCREHDLIALVDEVYEHLAYRPARHRRLATFEGMAERTVTLSSAGKSFSCTGWKVGWAIAPPGLTAALRRVHQFTVFSTSTAAQHATAEALALPDSFFERFLEEYGERRDILHSALDRSGFRARSPEGSYFILAEFADLPFDDSVALARALVVEAGVATIPPITFYLEPDRGASLLRFCFCKKLETLHEAGRRLEEWRGRIATV